MGRKRRLTSSGAKFAAKHSNHPRLAVVRNQTTASDDTIIEEAAQVIKTTIEQPVETKQVIEDAVEADAVTTNSVEATKSKKTTPTAKKRSSVKRTTSKTKTKKSTTNTSTKK